MSKCLHLGPVLPDIEQLDDVGVSNKLENGHFSLNSQRHASKAAIGARGWLPVVDPIQVGQAAGLGHMGRTLGDDLDCHQLMRNPMASQANSR